MANNYKTNPVYIDTYASAVDLASSMGYSAGTPIKLISIEWANPVTVNDVAVVKDKASGTPIFSVTCDVAKKSIVKYFDEGTWVSNLYIEAGGLSSGQLLITLG